MFVCYVEAALGIYKKDVVEIEFWRDEHPTSNLLEYDESNAPKNVEAVNIISGIEKNDVAENELRRYECTSLYLREYGESNTPRNVGAVVIDSGIEKKNEFQWRNTN